MRRRPQAASRARAEHPPAAAECSGGVPVRCGRADLTVAKCRRARALAMERRPGRRRAAASTRRTRVMRRAERWHEWTHDDDAWRAGGEVVAVRRSSQQQQVCADETNGATPRTARRARWGRGGFCVVPWRRAPRCPEREKTRRQRAAGVGRRGDLGAREGS